uniref:Protein pinocchio n=1 Tax=Timema shepardi TaxID=629360 RepID=A0A7R9ATR8_TIMSH|nr:unnamed protein product [Timema shepardi]
MSMTRVHPPEMHNTLSRRSSSIGSLGSSLEELHHYFNSSDAVLSIEELRLQLNSCFTCGVSWHDEHVSLDCRECGGYSLERPCPLCDGRCNSVWKRDLTMLADALVVLSSTAEDKEIEVRISSHATGKARWEGECALRCKPAADSKFGFKSISAEEESRLCSRLEKLGASS